MKTNVSFWKELESTKAVLMGETAVVEIDTFPRGVILIYLVIAFSPFGYFLAIHIVAEKEKKLKEFLKIMGLHDTAFWYVTRTLLFSVANNCVSSTHLQYWSSVTHRTQQGPDPLFLQFPPLSWSLRLITKLQQLTGLFEHKGGGLWEAHVNIIYLSFILCFVWWGMLHVFQCIEKQEIVES